MRLRRRDCALGLGLVLLATSPAAGQATLTTDAGIFNAYVWRGVSLTNRPVAQPDAYLTVPVGGGSAVFGGWANVDLGQYNGGAELSEGGGRSSLDVTEVDLWAEYGRPVGLGLTATGGVLGYLFPNGAGLTNQINRTVEVYGKLQAASVPLTPKLAVWYDLDKVNGAYIETSIAQPLSIPTFPLTLGAVAAFSAGQGVKGSDPTEIANFSGNGFTHLDLNVSGSLSAGPVIVSPSAHFLILHDDFTQVTRPGRTRDAKAWFGVTLTWAKALTRSAGTN